MLGWEERNKRFNSHELDGDQEDRIRKLRIVFENLAQHIDAWCPDSREKSLAFTSLEQCQFWSNASIARSERVEDAASD